MHGPRLTLLGCVPNLTQHLLILSTEMPNLHIVDQLNSPWAHGMMAFKLVLTSGGTVRTWTQAYRPVTCVFHLPSCELNNVLSGRSDNIIARATYVVSGGNLRARRDAATGVRTGVRNMRIRG